VKGKEVEIYVG